MACQINSRRCSGSRPETQSLLPCEMSAKYRMKCTPETNARGGIRSMKQEQGLGGVFQAPTPGKRRDKKREDRKVPSKSPLLAFNLLLDP